MWDRTMILPDTQSLAIASANWLAEGLNQNANALLCIAAGYTQREMLALLCERARAGKIDFSKLRVLGLDEWIGLGPEDEGSRQFQLYNSFFKPVGLRSDQITFFNAKAADLDAECQRIDEYLDENGPIDLLILGVGMNGHVGFNEPGSLINQRTYHRELDPVSSVIGQKYFPQPRELKRGITLGLYDLIQAKKILIQVTGEDKARVMRAALARPHQPELPVSHFWPLKSATLFMDRAAAGLLPSSPQYL